MTDDMRKNLGMLVLAIPVVLVGLAVAQAPIPALGGLVMIVGFGMALVATVRCGVALMRPRDPKPTGTDAP